MESVAIAAVSSAVVAVIAVEQADTAAFAVWFPV